MTLSYLCRNSAVAAATALLLGGCTNTILSSVNPSRDRPSKWYDYASLPVEIHGRTPDRTTAQLAALFPQGPDQHLSADGTASLTGAKRRIVLYINPSERPRASSLCSSAEAFSEGRQDGAVASVSGALCDGDIEASRARGDVLTRQQSDKNLQRDFRTITATLYNALYPGANQTGQYAN